MLPVALLLLVLVPIAYQNIPFVRENIYIITPVLYLLVTSIILVLLLHRAILVSSNRFEVYPLLFFLYVFVRLIFVLAFDIMPMAQGLLLILLYLALKRSFVNIHTYILSKILIIGLLCSVSISLLIYGLQNGGLLQRTDAIFIPNKSIFCILLAAQIVFLISHFLGAGPQKAVQLLRWVILSVCLLAISFLIILEGRSGWLGFIIALLFTTYQYCNKVFFRKLIVIAGSMLGATALTILLFYKLGSTQGRFLIYKIAAKMLTENLLFGIGFGQFKIKYNLYQANYFETTGGSPGEALLADKTIYAFNDPLQLLIENGLFGFVLFILAIIILVKLIIKVIKQNKNNPLLIAAVSSVICIATGAFFSYPLQIFPILILLVVCLAIIHAFLPPEDHQGVVTKARLTKRSLFFIGLLLMVHFLLFFQYTIKGHNALELSMIGYKRESIKKFKQVNRYYFKDGNILFLHAKELYDVNQLNEAFEVIQTAKRYISTTELYKLSALVNYSLGNFNQAEMDYKTALYMIPNRMSSKFDLVQFYINRKDTVNARYWANVILKMEVKIQSAKTRALQEEARNILKRIE